MAFEVMGYIEAIVDWVRKFGVSVLLLTLLLVPAIACVQSGEPMTAAERMCCMQMHGQCDGMTMSGTHSCCDKQAPSEHSALVLKGDYGAHLVLVSVESENIVVPQQNESRVAYLSVSPPPSPPSSTAILRI